MLIDRFSPSVPAKANVTHRTPDVTERRVVISSSKAKLKIRMTSSEKTSMDVKSSRERSSAARSFQATAPTARRKPAAGDSRRGGVPDCRPISIHQRALVEREQVAAAELRARG